MKSHIVKATTLACAESARPQNKYVVFLPKLRIRLRVAMMANFGSEHTHGTRPLRIALDFRAVTFSDSYKFE